MSNLVADEVKPENIENIREIIQRIKDRAKRYQGNPFQSLFLLHQQLSDKDGRKSIVQELAQETGYPELMIDGVCFEPFSWDLSNLSGINLTKGMNPYPYGYIYVQGDMPKGKPHTPELITHIGFGNLPGFGPLSFLTGFQIYSETGKMPSQLYKLSSQERIFIPYYLERLSEIDPELASVLAAVYWPGGKKSIENIVYRESDALIPFGSSETLEAIQRNSRRLFGRGPYVVTKHGTKIGQGYHEGEFTESDAMLYAFDAYAFFGLSCFNLKKLYIEGSRDNVEKAAELLREALERYLQIFGTLRDTRWSNTIGFDLTYFSRSLGQGVKIYRPNSGGNQFLVYVSDEPIMPPDKGVIINVIPTGNRSNLLERLQETPPYGKQTFVTNLTDENYLIKIAQAGFTRICLPGSAPYPKPGPHDGTIDAMEVLYGCWPRTVSIEVPGGNYQTYRQAQNNFLNQRFFS